MLQAVGSFHAENPDLQGLAAERLRLALDPRLPRPVFLAALARVVGAGKAVTEGSWVRIAGSRSPTQPGRRGALGPHRAVISRKIVERFRPPRVRDLAGLTGEPETDVRRICKLASRSGRVDQVAPDHFFARATVAEMAEIVRDLSSQDPEGCVFGRAVPRPGRQRAQGGDPDPRVLRSPRADDPPRRPATAEPASRRPVRRDAALRATLRV